MTTYNLTSGDDVITTDSNLFGDVTGGASGLDLLGNTVNGGAGSDTADYSEKTTAVAVTLNGATAGLRATSSFTTSRTLNLSNATTTNNVLGIKFHSLICVIDNNHWNIFH